MGLAHGTHNSVTNTNSASHSMKSVMDRIAGCFSLRKMATSLVTSSFLLPCLVMTLTAVGALVTTLVHLKTLPNLPLGDKQILS